MTNTAAASQKLAARELPSINFEARNAISIAADSGTIRAGSAATQRLPGRLLARFARGNLMVLE